MPPDDKTIAVTKGMWEVLSDGSLVRLEITFQCVNEDHRQLLAHEINQFAQAKNFWVETHRRPCNSCWLPTQTLTSSPLESATIECLTQTNFWHSKVMNQTLL